MSSSQKFQLKKKEHVSKLVEFSDLFNLKVNLIVKDPKEAGLSFEFRSSDSFCRDFIDKLYKMEHEIISSMNFENIISSSVPPPLKNHQNI